MLATFAAVPAGMPTSLQGCQALKGWAMQAKCGWVLSQNVNLGNMGHVIGHGAGISPGAGLAIAAIVLLLILTARRRAAGTVRRR